MHLLGADSRAGCVIKQFSIGILQLRYLTVADVFLNINNGLCLLGSIGEMELEITVGNHIAITEEGNLIITRNGKQTIYSSDGRIIEDNGIKYYYKKDGTLDYTQEEQNQLTIKEYYEDAALKRREEYEKEIPIRTIVYKKETIETTFYENGIKYATITYAGDGYKVLNIQYHNEKK